MVFRKYFTPDLKNKTTCMFIRKKQQTLEVAAFRCSRKKNLLDRGFDKLLSIYSRIVEITI